MNEETRLKIVSEVQRKKNLISKKGSLEQEIANLKKNKSVAKYLKLSHEISVIDSMYIGKTEKEIIDHEFLQISSQVDCSHPLYVYIGSYDAYPYLVKNEMADNFVYNAYCCLECGELQNKNKEQFKEFEETNNVIKHVLPNIISIHSYMQLYCYIHREYRRLYLQYNEQEVIAKTKEIDMSKMKCYKPL